MTASNRLLNLEGDEVWIVDLALGQELQLQRSLLELTEKTKLSDERDQAIAHHKRLLAAAKAVEAKLTASDSEAARLAYLASQQEAEKIGAALSKASELEQAIRACLNDPGLVSAFMQAERPELLKRLANALELDPFDVAQTARGPMPLGPYEEGWQHSSRRRA